MNNKNYYPIGTVCKLKNAKKRIMITGYLPIDNKKNNIVYDYCGCMFPMGIISSKINFLFNEKDIESIYFKGYRDVEYDEFIKKIENSQNQISNYSKESESGIL